MPSLPQSVRFLAGLNAALVVPRLCEKPFASNGAEVAEMYAEADKQGVLLQEGMWTRFFPATEVSVPHPWCRTVGRLC